MRRETSTIEEAETMTAAEMIRAMDLYRQLSGKPMVDPGIVEVAPAEPAPPIEEPATMPAGEADKPAGTDATVTPLDVTRKR
jgi:hypothetical protein